MKTSFPRSERPRVRVLRELREGLLGGRWNGGSMFPPENELAEVLSASRSTVRLVLKQLESEGLLRSERGRGRLVVGRQTGLMAQTVAILRQNLVQAEPFRNTGAEKAVEAAITDTLRAAGRHVLSLHTGALQTDVLDRLIADCPSGVISDHESASMPGVHVALTRLAAAGSRVVVNGDMPSAQNFDRVVSDHASGSYQLTRWLLQRGYRRLLRVWEEIGENYWLSARDRGFERAMAEAGIEAAKPVRVTCLTRAVDQESPDAAEVFELRSRQYAGFLADVVLRDPAPQVLIAMNDVSMLLVARALRILGRTPGREIAVVGYDNFWPQSKDRRLEPYVPLATVDKRNDLIGRRTAELMMMRLEKKLPSEAQRIFVEPELVVSDSSTNEIAGNERKSDSTGGGNHEP